MLTMQAFHKTLFSNGNDQAPYLQGLLDLTDANLTQIEAVKSDLIWETWVQ